MNYHNILSRALSNDPTLTISEVLSALQEIDKQILNLQDKFMDAKADLESLLASNAISAEISKAQLKVDQLEREIDLMIDNAFDQLIIWLNNNKPKVQKP